MGLFGLSWDDVLGLFRKREKAVVDAERDVAEIQRLILQEKECLSNMNNAIKAMCEMVHGNKADDAIRHYVGVIDRIALENVIDKRKEMINNELNKYVIRDLLDVGSKYKDNARTIFDQHSMAYGNNYRKILETFSKLKKVGQHVISDLAAAGLAA